MCASLWFESFFGLPKPKDYSDGNQENGSFVVRSFFSPLELAMVVASICVPCPHINGFDISGTVFFSSCRHMTMIWMKALFVSRLFVLFFKVVRLADHFARALMYS